MFHEILGKIEQFRVRVSSESAGVRREKREERREKKEKRFKKINGTGWETFYISAEPGGF